VEGCLRHDRWQVRRAACRALGAAHAESSTSALVKSLLDPHATVRAAALRALREIHGVRAAYALADRLPDANDALRPALLYAVARIDGVAAAEAIRAHVLADDPAANVRIAVCQVSDPFRATTMLERLAEDRDAGVRNAALHALSADGGRDE
jgi:HEAT repeat protein